MKVLGLELVLVLGLGLGKGQNIGLLWNKNPVTQSPTQSPTLSFL